MDTRIKVHQIIPLFSCGADIVSSDHTTIVAERVIDISDEELMRLGRRFLELITERRPKGEWKQGFSHKYVCSRCEQGTDIESDYCAWCGADMRGEE